jgi:hypothetical protein
MAHKDAQETFDRHFPLWWDLGHDLLIVYPQGAKVLLPTIKGVQTQTISTLEIGKPAHTGVESIVRFRTLLEHMHGQGYERYAFFEYDALCFGELPEKFGLIAGNVFRDNSPNRSFIGTMFVHPPLMFLQKGLDAVVEEMNGMALTAEGATWDRWFGLCMERIGMPIFNFMEAKIGTARNTWHASELPTLRAEVLGGARLIHGIKSAEAFNVASEAYRLYANHQELIKEGVIKGDGI